MDDDADLHVDVRHEYSVVLELQSEIDTILAQTEDSLSTVVPEISKWSIGMQIEHILLANKMVTTGLLAISNGGHEDSQPGDINRLGRILLGRGTIPRGKAQAPSVYEPKTNLDITAIRELARQCSSSIIRLKHHLPTIAEEKLGFGHPYFGVLSAPAWMRFLHVHTLHHLKIIRDIRESSSS